MSTCLCGRDHDADVTTAHRRAVESPGFVALVGDGPRFTYEYDGTRLPLYDAVALCVVPDDDGRKVWRVDEYNAEPDGYIRVTPRVGSGVAASHDMAVADAYRWLAWNSEWDEGLGRWRRMDYEPITAPDWVNG